MFHALTPIISLFFHINRPAFRSQNIQNAELNAAECVILFQLLALYAQRSLRAMHPRVCHWPESSVGH
jgi:hypothetical protein